MRCYSAKVPGCAQSRRTYAIGGIKLLCQGPIICLTVLMLRKPTKMQDGPFIKFRRRQLDMADHELLLYDPILSIMLLVFNAKQGCFLVISVNPKKASKRKQGHKTKALKGAFPTMSLLSLTAQPLQQIPCNVRWFWREIFPVQSQKIRCGKHSHADPSRENIAMLQMSACVNIA